MAESGLTSLRSRGPVAPEPVFTATQSSPPFRLKSCFIVPLVFLLIPIMASGATGKKHSRIGLVLSGGGSRGLAQIGVLKALDEKGIRPDLVVGTSMGAFVGALYCSGFSPDSMAVLARTTDWAQLYSNSARRKTLFVSQKDEPVNYLFELRFDDNLKPILPQSISQGQQFFDKLTPLLSPAQYHAHSDFDRLCPPLHVVTTDILSGKTIILTGGNLPRAVRASSGAPLAFSPLANDTTLLMDGGLTANIPVDAARDDRCDYVIAVDVTSPLWHRKDLDNPVRLVDQLIAIGINRRKERERQLANLLIVPDLTGYSNTDFSQIDSLIERGYRATMEALASKPELLRPPQPVPTLKQSVVLPLRWLNTNPQFAAHVDSLIDESKTEGVAIDSLLVAKTVRRVGSQLDFPYAHLTEFSPNDTSTLVSADMGTISAVVVRGNNRTSTRKLTSALNVHEGEALRGRTLGEMVTTLYSTGLFHTVEAEMDTLNRVLIDVREKNHLRIRSGLRFDEFHLGEGYVEPAYENLFGRGIGFACRLQYGLRREKYTLELQGNQIISPWWANNLIARAYIGRERIVDEQLLTEYPDSTKPTESRNVIRYNAASIHKLGILAQVGMQVGQFSMLSGGFRLEQYETYRTDAPLTYDPGMFGEGLRVLMAALTIDNLDRYPFPRSGQRHRISLTAATDFLGGATQFLKVDGFTSYYHTFAKRHTVTPQFHFAWASDSLPSGERVQLGGSPTEEGHKSAGFYNQIPFAGLKPRALPGDILALLHLGYRVRLYRKLYGSCALDWGYTWYRNRMPGSRTMVSDFIARAPLGLRLGAEYNTPIGPVRFAWGRLLTHASVIDPADYSNVLYFSAGHDF